MKQTSPCPKCGKRVGWSEVRRLTYEQHFTPDGIPDFAADLDTKHFTRKRCLGCYAIITKTISDA